MNLIENLIGWFVRRRILRKFKSFGIGSKITLPIEDISYPENIEIGSYVYIGPGAKFYARGGIKIGNNVSIGPRVEIHTSNHRYEGTMIPYDNYVVLKPVVIEDNVWIGANVAIVPGVTIHEGAVIGMNSVVTKDVEKCAVVGGNPARVIKYRDISRYESLKKKKKFWIKYAYNRTKEERNYKEVFR